MIIRKRPRALQLKSRITSAPLRRQSSSRRYASTTVSAAVAPASELDGGSAPIQQYPPLQPPSLKPADLRKSQLHRQYTSIIRSAPLMLLFQHNNLKATEWAGIRRELDMALKKVDAAAAAKAQELGGAEVDGMRQRDTPEGQARFQVISTNIFAAALRVVEHYHPPQDAETSHNHADPATGAISPQAQIHHKPAHYLSKEAYEAAMLPAAPSRRPGRKPTSLDPLLSGPIAALTFPSIAPAHLAAALSILAPTPGAQSAFPAPKRREQPSWHDPVIQSGLQKLMLLGARVDGKTMDQAGVRGVGLLAGRGGIEGLRAEVVALLQGVGMGLVGGLDRVSLGLWGTLEGRRQSLEGEGAEGKSEA